MRLHDLFETVQFKRDNPGGDWLQRKQEGAVARHKYMNGPITGYFTQLVALPTKLLITLPGARGEEEFRMTSIKMDRLKQHVPSPSEFDSKSYPPLIGVNHFGEAYIMEGNHRIAYAHLHGIERVYVEVRYFNGGETAGGVLTPETVLRYCQ